MAALPLIGHALNKAEMEYHGKFGHILGRIQHIDIPVCFLQDKFENGLFLTKYKKSSVVSADMCTKPCSGPIISCSTKCMTGFRFYPTSETEHYQFMRLHEFIVK